MATRDTPTKPSISPKKKAAKKTVTKTVVKPVVKKTPPKKTAAPKKAVKATPAPVDDVITISLDTDWNLLELTRHLPGTDSSDTIGSVTLERVLNTKGDARIKIYYMVLDESDDSFTVDVAHDEGSRGVVSIKPKELKPFVTLFINRRTGFCEVNIPEDAPLDIDNWKIKLTVQRVKHTVVH